MTYYVEAWNLRDAVNSLRNGKWSGKQSLALNRLKRKLDAAVGPMEDEIAKHRGKDDLQEIANSIGREQLDEPPALPDEPILSIEDVEEMESDVLTGFQLEILQYNGIVEKDESWQEQEQESQ